MGQELHGDVPLNVGESGVELLQLEDHPSRGESMSVSATATAKVCAGCAGFVFTDFLRG